MSGNFRQAITLLFLIGSALVAWHLSHVVLLAFAALIVAAIIHGCREIVERFTPLRAGAATLAAMLGLGIALSLFLYILGRQIHEQLGDLLEQMPELIDRAADALEIEDIWGGIESAMEMIDPGAFAGGVGAGVLGFLGAISAVVIIVVGGIYFASEPGLYRRGIIALFPDRLKPRSGLAIDASADALKRWLGGQAIAMVVVGSATTVALLTLGMPSALAIGFIAGVLEFIPFIGPILAAIPALLVALGEGEDMVIWVAAVYILIQQVEGNVLVPLIQKKTVRLPPALGLFAILAFGIAFGPWGFILATPLTVVLMTLIHKLYIEKRTGQGD